MSCDLVKGLNEERDVCDAVELVHSRSATNFSFEAKRDRRERATKNACPKTSQYFSQVLQHPALANNPLSHANTIQSGAPALQDKLAHEDAQEEGDEHKE
eukprot:m.522987 g.522987  ORF g.522987 m.522987 type:complete len:100 (-) comp57521_c1_seq2:934-1233(-)